MVWSYYNSDRLGIDFRCRRKERGAGGVGGSGSGVEGGVIGPRIRAQRRWWRQGCTVGVRRAEYMVFAEYSIIAAEGVHDRFS